MGSSCRTWTWLNPSQAFTSGNWANGVAELGGDVEGVDLFAPSQGPSRERFVRK